MPLHETEAFVLRNYALKEADKICVFFTREAGKMRGVAHGARRLRSRYGASLEPFTEVMLVYFQQENRELASISSCDIVRSPFVAGISSERLSVYHYLGELIAEFLPEQEPNEKVYRLIGAVTRGMETVSGDEGPGLLAAARYFELWLLRLSGFASDWRECAVCGEWMGGGTGIWLTGEGVAQCAGCSERMGEELSGGVWRLVLRIYGQGPGEFLQGPMDGRDLQRLGGVLTRLIARVLERQLRSYEFLGRLRPFDPGA